MSVRTELEAYLKSKVPSTWKVLEYGSPTIAKPTLMLYVEKVEPGELLSTTTYNTNHTLTLLLLTAKQTGNGAQPELETNLNVVLKALDEHDLLAWTAAENAVYLDTYPAYKITISIITQTTESEED